MWYLLNERERQLCRQLDVDYWNKFKIDPAKDPNLVYFLGDRFEFCRTWSAVSRAIPTFRKNGGKYLFRRQMRFLTHVDKLACLGWPVTGPTAASMGTTPLPALDPMRSDIMAGNSMHLTCAATILLLGTVCFGLKKD